MEDKEFEGEWMERVLLEGYGLEGEGGHIQHIYLHECC